ncbi:hypothetical protein MASR2M74_16260 [Paracoccaceae bacterium]
MQDKAQVTRLSTALYRGASLLLPLLPLLVLGYGLWGASNPDWLAGAFAGLPEGTRLTPWKSTAVLAIGAIALVPILMALWQMRGLFARYRRGEILTAACAAHIRRTGSALALLALAQVLIRPLQILVLTADNPAGQKILAISLSSEVLWLALAGGLLVVIGRVMAEAARVAEENAGFI